MSIDCEPPTCAVCGRANGLVPVGAGCSGAALWLDCGGCMGSMDCEDWMVGRDGEKPPVFWGEFLANGFVDNLFGLLGLNGFPPVGCGCMSIEARKGLVVCGCNPCDAGPVNDGCRKGAEPFCGACC